MPDDILVYIAQFCTLPTWSTLLLVCLFIIAVSHSLFLSYPHCLYANSSVCLLEFVSCPLALCMNIHFPGQ